jgi:cysteinyl-tRNA synthetase
VTVVRRVRIYDTMSREVRLFAPIAPPRVGMFVCGLTPQSEAHIGHGRTSVVFDVVARALRRWGYRVLYIQNVTNLDDRVIARAAETGADPLDLSEQNFVAYRLAMDELGVRSVNAYPFATDYIPEIVDQIQRLLDRGYAYAADGSVYFDVAKFPDYGKLSGQRREEQRPGTRVAVDAKKRAPEDFALWKAATPGEPSWETPWGPGRPGWHIEDTAIAGRLLGDRYDLHGGGVELKFPHHEAEIAQAEASSGQTPFVNYWMHAGLVMMKGEKMSKSLGNVAPLSSTLKRFGADVLRFYYLNAHYRSPIEFEEGTSLQVATEALDRLAQPYRRVATLLAEEGLARAGRELPEDLENRAESAVQRMEEALANDFNTREAIAALFGWAAALSAHSERLEAYSGSALSTLGSPYRWAAEMLGLFERVEADRAPANVGALVQTVLSARERARARGDFAESDRIRDELAAAGIHVEDAAGGTRWDIRRRRGR